MAQTGYTAIQLYYSTTVSATPAAVDLAAGELAINTVDEKLYFKNSSGTVKVLAATLMVGTNGGTGVNNGSRTISYAGNVAFTGAFNPTFAIPSSSTYTFPTGDSTLVATTGTVANATNATTAATATAANGIKTATTTVSVSGSTAPSSGQVLIASSTTLAAWGTPTVALSSVTAAGGSATIANGNNPLVWNWAQTTASQTAFTFGETSAATGGSGSQVLLKVGTAASSTADPLQVATRGVDTIRISRTGAVTITALNGTTGSGTTGSAVSITAGQGASTSFGGDVTITAGAGGSSSGTGGAVTITGGASTSTSDTGGSLTLSSGASGSLTGTGSSVTITAKNGGSFSGDGGSVSITAGNGPGAAMTGGDISFTPGTGSTAGRVRFNNSSTANGTVATVLGSVGPTGAHTTVQEWLTLRVGANTRYIPCF